MLKLFCRFFDSHAEEVRASYIPRAGGRVKSVARFVGGVQGEETGGGYTSDYVWKMCLTPSVSEVPKFLGVGPEQWAKDFMNISRLYCVLGVAQDLGTIHIQVRMSSVPRS